MSNKDLRDVSDAINMLQSCKQRGVCAPGVVSIMPALTKTEISQMERASRKRGEGKAKLWTRRFS